MYELRPPAVFVHQSVVEDPLCKGRFEAVMGALEEPVEARVYADEELPRIIKEGELLAGRVPMGTLEQIHDPILGSAGCW